jgi:hypothetical protein
MGALSGLGNCTYDDVHDFSGVSSATLRNQHYTCDWNDGRPRPLDAVLTLSFCRETSSLGHLLRKVPISYNLEDQGTKLCYEMGRVHWDHTTQCSFINLQINSFPLTKLRGSTLLSPSVCIGTMS